MILTEYPLDIKRLKINNNNNEKEDSKHSKSISRHLLSLKIK
jgi:hypothetical protein